MKNTAINLGVIRKVANALGELNDKVVYVGGAVVSLYINDPAADDVRPTKDVDISLEILTLSELEQLRQELITRGFYQTFEDKVICRFRFEDIKVDVMSTQEIGWAPSDQWFAPGFKLLETIDFDGVKIRILPLSYFLASKLDAYHERGGTDPRTSRDFEDIVYILDNRTDLVEVILNSPGDVLVFLQEEFSKIIASNLLREALQGNLYYETRAKRFQIIKDQLKAICDGI